MFHWNLSDVFTIMPPCATNTQVQHSDSYTKCLEDSTLWLRLCEEILQLIKDGKIDTTPLITYRFPLSKNEEAYRILDNKEDGVITITIYNSI